MKKEVFELFVGDALEYVTAKHDSTADIAFGRMIGRRGAAYLLDALTAEEYERMAQVIQAALDARMIVSRRRCHKEAA